jgi:CheY-like chemotaxis protein
MNTIRTFIVVDDDLFNNMICSLIIKRTLGEETDTKTFSSPEEGLAFIQKEYAEPLKPTILFLDINMPTLTGWEFMEQYEAFSNRIKDQITIYIVSSSVNERDKEKAKANKYISGFISKPLESQIILSLQGV